MPFTAWPGSRSCLILAAWLWKGTMLHITEKSLKGWRAGNGTMYGDAVSSYFVKNFQRKKEWENQPPFSSALLSLSLYQEWQRGFTSFCRSGRYCIWPWETGRENGWIIVININLVIIYGIYIALFSKELQTHYSLILATSLCCVTDTEDVRLSLIHLKAQAKKWEVKLWEQDSWPDCTLVYEIFSSVVKMHVFLRMLCLKWHFTLSILYVIVQLLSQMLLRLKSSLPFSS